MPLATSFNVAEGPALVSRSFSGELQTQEHAEAGLKIGLSNVLQLQDFGIQNAFV